MEVEKLLNRLYIKKSDVTKDRKFLALLQLRFLDHIPWENLDLITGKEIKLTYEAVFEKLVLNGRGGWCHETNGLLAWGLRQLGFKVTLLNCRVFWAHLGCFGPEFEHMAPLVELPNGEAYIVDCGMALSCAPCEPIKLEHTHVSVQHGGKFKMVKTAWPSNGKELWQVELQSLEDTDNWGRVYCFRLEDHRIEEFKQCKVLYDPEVATFMRTNPIIYRKTNQGNDVHLLVKNKYRHYRDIGSPSKKETVAKEDNLDMAEIEKILNEKFNLKVDLRSIGLVKSVDEGGWVENIS